jgi:hypothetical protein
MPHIPNKVYRLTPDIFRQRDCDRLRKLYSTGVIGWYVRIEGVLASEEDAGFEIGDVEHVFDTGTVRLSEAITSATLGEHARRYVLGGLTAQGMPVELTIETKGRMGVVTAVRWFRGGGEPPERRH